MYYAQFNFTVFIISKKEDKGRNTKSPKSPIQMPGNFLLSKPPASSQDSDIHIIVLCLKALMNNTVSL